MVKSEEDVSVFIDLFVLLSRIVFDGLDIKDMKLSNMGLLALLVLHANPGISMTTITEELGTSKTQVSRLIGSLEQQNLVERKHNVDNRRVVNVFLTSYGEDTIQQKKKQVATHISKKLTPLPEEEYKEFNNHLAALKILLKQTDFIKEKN